MTDKDYSLLRPFDLEAAKRGDPIIWTPNIDCVFLGESINRPNIPEEGPQYRIEHSGGMSYASARRLRMAPLAWVEGRPVYRCDVLYGKGDKLKFVAQQEGLLCEHSGELVEWKYVSEVGYTWTTPKVKLLAWFDGYALEWRVEGATLHKGWKRVPSEDKIIQVEEVSCD